MSIDLQDLLTRLHERVREKLEKEPRVTAKDETFDVDGLPVDAPHWHRISDVVALVFDLKSSTNLEKGRSPASTASIYDAGVVGVVRVLDELGADFVDIQGDGGFGLFWGESRYERALCAAITVRTFSKDFTSQLRTKWKNAPGTGFKVGVASGPVLAKVLGLPRMKDLQEPVWAGRPVNYASKAAQQTDPEHILVTASVWDEIQENDYLTFSCGCVDGEDSQAEPVLLWKSHDLEKIPDTQRFGQSLKSVWCERHGQHYLDAVLVGHTRREDIAVSARSDRTLLGRETEEKVEARKARDRYRRGLYKETDAP
jgi:class 3 adenylate cyclase